MRSDRYAGRLAGFMFLFLIAAVLASSILSRGVGGATENTFRVRLSVLLLIVGSISTLILAAMLYAITKHQDKNLAILALLCRAVEAALYVTGIMSLLALLSLSKGTALGDLVSNLRLWGTNVGAIFFAVGSTLYSYLLFKARSVPVPLAGLGVVASLILVVGVPLQTAAGRSIYDGAFAAIWIPIAIFEISTGFWLLIKGAKVPEAG
jgi:Domain of unknown function (DUF4386)